MESLSSATRSLYLMAFSLEVTSHTSFVQDLVIAVEKLLHVLDKMDASFDNPMAPLPPELNKIYDGCAADLRVLRLQICKAFRDPLDAFASLWAPPTHQHLIPSVIATLQLHYERLLPWANSSAVYVRHILCCPAFR